MRPKTTRLKKYHVHTYSGVSFVNLCVLVLDNNLSEIQLTGRIVVEPGTDIFPSDVRKNPLVPKNYVVTATLQHDV